MESEIQSQLDAGKTERVVSEVVSLFVFFFFFFFFFFGGDTEHIHGPCKIYDMHTLFLDYCMPPQHAMSIFLMDWST